LIFDLDPPDASFELVEKTARAMRAVLHDELDLPAFLMTTGSRGMHVVIP